MFLENPLDKFQSYSVHYILLACRTTVVAKDFASDTNAREALAAINSVDSLGAPVPFKRNTTDIFLVIDTRRFGQFTVESLKYDVYINGLQKGSSTSNLAADLSMTVLDSVGISFANFMQWLMDTQMKTNFDGLIFMLQVVFVGHKVDGTTETVQSETIPMHLNKMEINLNFAKGAYTLEFMPNLNFDVKRHGRFLNISTSTSYKSIDGTLGSIIDSLQKNLNTASEAYFNSIQERTKSFTGGLVKLGRKVNYMITLPKNWPSFRTESRSTGGTGERNFAKHLQDAQEKKAKEEQAKSGVNGDGQIKDSYISVPPGISIPEALDIIFSTVPDIAKMGNFESQTIGDGAVKFFKYIVGLTSDDEIMTVHVDVVEFTVPNVFVNQTKTLNQISANEKEFYHIYEKDGVVVREPKDFIEMDYIFTGMNKDILEFELKIQDFQFLLASNLRIGDTAIDDVSDNPDAQGAIKKQTGEHLLYSREFDPMLMPLNTKAALDNLTKYTAFLKSAGEAQKQIEESQSYTQNLSKFYAGSPIIAILTIKGNPKIMHKFNVGTVLDHVPGDISNAQAKLSYRADLDERILKSINGNDKTKASSAGAGTFVIANELSPRSYATSPVFAKINIKGPNVDFKTGATVPGEFTTSVLSDNYYVVFKLTNNFTGHNFTQDLELYSHNIFGNNKLSTKQQ